MYSDMGFSKIMLKKVPFFIYGLPFINNMYYLCTRIWGKPLR